MTLFELRKIYPPDLKFTDLNSSRFKVFKPKANAINNKSNHPIILLALQVPLDVNMIYHSPLFKSHTEIIKDIYSNLPENTQLIIREHPLYINKYESSFYDFVNEHKIIIDNFTPLNKAIESSDAIVVNNSTVGIEAILKYKTVIVLGNSFYDHPNICLKLSNKNELKILLENALTHAPDRQKINAFKHFLFSRVLLKGSITDKDLKSSKRIANHLLANH